MCVYLFFLFFYYYLLRSNCLPLKTPSSFFILNLASIQGMHDATYLPFRRTRTAGDRAMSSQSTKVQNQSMAYSPYFIFAFFVISFAKLKCELRPQTPRLHALSVVRSALSIVNNQKNCVSTIYFVDLLRGVRKLYNKKKLVKKTYLVHPPCCV